MENEKCFFCGTACSVHDTTENGPAITYTCPLCGIYDLPLSLQTTIETSSVYNEKKHLIAGYLAETKDHEEWDIRRMSTRSLDLILSDHRVPHTTIQRLEKLLLFLYKGIHRIGAQKQVIYYQGSGSQDEGMIAPTDAYAYDTAELLAMINELKELGWIKQIGGSSAYCSTITLTVDGLRHAEQLIGTNAESKKVFVAMGFKKDLLAAMQNAIKPACHACGFDAFLISETEHNHGIADEIIVGIKTSKFVIVDFTYNNCGAYFEAGYAQGRGLEVIRCCKSEWFEQKDPAGNKQNHVHFDVAHFNLILWDNEADLERKLKSRIRATIPNATMFDPVS